MAWLLFCAWGYSQEPYCLRGKVVYADKQEAASGLGVKFYDSIGAPMRSFVYLEADGTFRECFPNPRITLKIGGLVVKDTLIAITLKPSENEYTFQVKRKTSRLSEILLESKKAVRDTIDYVLDSLQFHEDDKLADILQKLPGFEVKNGNEIYHNGRVVKRLLINGKDFLSSNQEIALDNFTKKHLEALSVYENYKDPFRNHLQAERGELAVDLKASKYLKGIPSSKVRLFGGYRDRYGGDINFMLLKTKSFSFFKNATNNLNEKPNFSQETRLAGSFFSSSYGLFNKALIGNGNFISYSNAFYKYQDDNTFLRVSAYPKHATNGYQNTTYRNSQEGTYRLEGRSDHLANQWYVAADATKKIKRFIASYSFLYDYVKAGDRERFSLLSNQNSNRSQYNASGEGHTLNNRILIDQAFSENDILTLDVSSLLRFYGANSSFSDAYAAPSDTDYKRSDIKTSLDYKKQFKRFFLKTSLKYTGISENASNQLDALQKLNLSIHDFGLHETLQFKIGNLTNDFSVGAGYNLINSRAGRWVYPFSLESIYKINQLLSVSLGGSRSYYNNFSDYGLLNRRTGVDTYLAGDPELTQRLRTILSGYVRFNYLDSFKSRSAGISGSVYENSDIPSYNVSVEGERFVYRVFLSDQRGISADSYASYRLSVLKKVSFDLRGNAGASQAAMINKLAAQKEYGATTYNAGAELVISNRWPFAERFKFTVSLDYNDSDSAYKDNVFRQQAFTQAFGLSYRDKKLTANVSYTIIRNYAQKQLLINFENINLSCKLLISKRSSLTLNGINLLSLVRDANLTTASAVSNAQTIRSLPVMSYIGVGYLFVII